MIQNYRFLKLIHIKTVGRHQKFCCKLTHIDYDNNQPKMVDISEKISTHRMAHAQVRNVLHLCSYFHFLHLYHTYLNLVKLLISHV